MQHQPDISLVILNWNNKTLLRQCLLTLREHAPKNLTLQTIVVDNGSEDGSATMVQQEFPEVELIESNENLGYAAGNNLGIRAAKGTYTFLLNEDIEFIDDTIKTLYDYLEEHPNVIAVSPRLEYGNRTTQYSCRVFPRIGALYKQLLVDLKLAPKTEYWAEYKMDYWEHDDTRSVDQPMTTALMTHTDELQELGGFDEQFKNYFNDVDLAYRMKKGGKDIMFLGDMATIIHHHGQGMRKLKWGRVQAWNQGIRRFYKKHYVRSVWSPTYIALEIGLGLRTAALAIQYAFKKKNKYEK